MDKQVATKDKQKCRSLVEVEKLIAARLRSLKQEAGQLEKQLQELRTK